MGASRSDSSRDRAQSAPQQPSTLSAQQAGTLQRLFSRGLHPDVALLPYQMRRMKEDAPPKTKENRKTIRMKNICFLNKKTFDLKHLRDNKYVVTFEYSTSLDVYCSIYFFAGESVDKYNVSQSFHEKCPRPMFQHESDDEKKEEEDADAPKQSYIGTSYLLRKGYNIRFEQNVSDYMDLDAVEFKFFHENLAFNYYPIIVEFSLQKPSHCLLCEATAIEQKECNDDDDDASNRQYRAQQAYHNDGVQYITKSINYGKLTLGSNNLYCAQIFSQKTQVKNRAFESHDIYGLDRPTDPYSKEENLCVICMTMPRDTALSPCRHLCMCSLCAGQLLKRSNKCPVCRAYVSETLHISRTQKQSLPE